MSSIQRFYIQSECIKGKEVYFPTSFWNQLCNVLRYKVGDEVVLFDGSGYEYTARITKLSPREITASVIKTVRPSKEFPRRISLFHAILKRKAQSFLYQKVAELGVHDIYPFYSQRTVVVPKVFNYRHYSNILKESCELVGAVTLPVLHEIQSLRQSLEIAGKSSNSLTFFAWEGCKSPLFSEFPTEFFLQESAKQINIFIGPEGGFTELEVDSARSKGFHIVSLGPRIVRAETAAILAFVALLTRCGYI